MGKFNTEQQKAATAERGIHLVIAGPGTGKTRTLIQRISNTVKDLGVPPEQILILTFSRKAADEIRERLTSLSGIDFAAAFTGTFHSFCLSLLKENCEQYLAHSGMSQFPGVIDRDNEKKIMQELFMTDPGRFMGLPFDAVMKIMNRKRPFVKNASKRLEKCGLMPRIDEFREEYRLYKINNSLIDYNDMTSHATALLNSSDEVRNNTISRFGFIFVDEFQDTSHDDFNLLSLVAGKNTGIFMVGDDFQAIYGFRGARVDYLVNAEKYFTGIVKHRLTVNYRSHSEIVNVSNRFICHNTFRSKKVIISANGKGGIVRFHKLKHPAFEAEIVSQIMLSRKSSYNCAILYRNNYQGIKLRKQIHDEPDISFLTMHGSKGLEFDIVIITGVCDKIIPDRDTNIEDERRLFYVALTRARYELHIVYEEDNGNIPRFIRECGFRGR